MELTTRRILPNRKKAMVVLLTILLFHSLPLVNSTPEIKVVYYPIPINEVELRFDLGDSQLVYRGEIEANVATFKLPAALRGRWAKLRLNGVEVGNVLIPAEGTKAKFSKVVGANMIKGVVVNPKGEPVDALVVAVEKKKESWIIQLLKLFLLPVGIVFFIAGLFIDIIVATTIAFIAPGATVEYLKGAPMARIFSLPLSFSLSREPVTLNYRGSRVVLAFSQGENGFVMEGSKWQLKAVPYLFTVHPRRLLQLSVYGNYTQSEKKIILLYDDLVKEGYLFRQFSPGFSESDSKEIESKPGVTFVKLTMKPSAKISGYVYLERDGESKPLSNVLVAAVGSRGGGYAYTGKDGYFEINSNLEEGEVTVFIAYCRDYAFLGAEGGKWVFLYSVKALTGENVVLKIAPIEKPVLRGRVTFRGKPVENALVYVAAGTSEKPLPGSAAVTGRDGVFSLKLNGAPGDYLLVVKYGEYVVYSGKVSVEEGINELGDVEIYQGYPEDYSIVDVNVILPENIEAPRGVYTVIESEEGTWYWPKYPIPPGRYTIKIFPLSYNVLNCTEYVEKIVEVPSGSLVKYNIRIGYSRKFLENGTIDFKLQIDYKRAVYAYLGARETGVENEVEVVFDIISIWPDISGDVEISVEKDGSQILSQREGYKGVVIKRFRAERPGLYSIYARFEPAGYGRIEVASYYVKWGGEAKASIRFYSKKLKDNTVPAGEYVNFEIVIEDERLVREFNRIGDQISLTYTVYSPDGEIALQRTRQLSSLQFRDGELYLRESLKVGKSGEWRFVVEITGAPYIEYTVIEKTLKVESRWCISTYVLLGVLVLVGLAWRKK